MSVLELPFNGTFDAAAALGNLRAHAIPGAESIDGDSLSRIILVPSGLIEVKVSFAAGAGAGARQSPDAIAATVDSDDPADIRFATALIRRWLDLDLVPADVSAVLGGDPVTGPLLRKRPGLRVIGSAHPFETAIMTVLGQQVSLAAARTFGGRLVAAFGEQVPGSPLIAFPTAETIAASSPEEVQRNVGLTGARARTVHALASASAAGLDLTHDSDSDEFRANLLRIPGIGPWTADYLAVRVLGDRDGFTASDLVLRRALGGVSAKAAEAASGAWRPYRAYALFHLWTSASYLP